MPSGKNYEKKVSRFGEKKDTHTKNQNDGPRMGCVRSNNGMTFKEQ